MLKKMQALLWMVVAMACAVPLVHAQNPPVVAPYHQNSNPAFYVFGPQGSVSYGKEDSLQVLFVQVPVSAGEVTLYVYDPGSGARNEPKSTPTGSTVTTDFRVYGGAGAYSDATSQSVRPTAKQAGTLLDSKTYGTDTHNVWAPFGPYSVSQGEQVGEYAIFKIVAQGMEGTGGNFFKVGASAAGSEVFAYDVTMHLAKNQMDVHNLWIEIPAGTSSIIESNYDLDDAGVPMFQGKILKAASSGEWLSNPVTVAAATDATRIAYDVDRSNKQRYANAGFHFTDGNGVPLRMFFVPSEAKPAPPVTPNSCVIDTDLVNMVQTMPGEAFLNKAFSYTLTVTAKTDVANVTVSDTLSDNVTYGSSEPAAAVQGKKLVWELGDMDRGQTKTITVNVTPTAEGMVSSCAVITADPRCCVGVFVGQPILAITKTGPATALLDSDVAYVITVQNVGTAVAKNVVVTDNVPAGMTHPSGKTVSYNLGDLQPKQSKTVNISMKATERGRHCNTAVATSDNAAQVQAEACTVVQAQGLTVKKTGTQEQFSGKVATYNIVVTNTGDTALTNVTVTDTVPERLRILKAEGAAVAGRTATWTIANLPAGESKNYTIDVTTAAAGELCNRVDVTTAEGLTANDQACTLWKGVPALLLEVIDTDDPLLPGEETTYIIQVTNQGTADDHDVTIVANFPIEISPVSAEGATATTVAAKKVTTAAVPVLAPKKVVEWRIRAKADQAGDSRLKVELRSRILQTPVNEEESTHVY